MAISCKEVAVSWGWTVFASFKCYSLQINQSVSIENNKDKTEKDILTGLKDLLNLTTPNETYAILAGDLVTSTEILKLVVDYTTRAREDSVRTIEEVKVKKIIPATPSCY